MALSLFDNSDTSQAQATDLVAQALQGADDGELFVEKRETQGFSFDDGKLKAASFDESQGFGLRSVTGETAAYAHSTEISAAALKRAAAVCESMTKTSGGQVAASPEHTNQKLYSAHNPVEAIGFAEKISLLQKVDTFARALTIRLLTYGTGGLIAATDQREVTAILTKTKAKQWGFRSLLHEVIQSRLFLEK